MGFRRKGFHVRLLRINSEGPVDVRFNWWEKSHETHKPAEGIVKSIVVKIGPKDDCNTSPQLNKTLKTGSVGHRNYKSED